ncbi:MAG: hypothetical protein ACI8P9_005119 [Parasphingorhabdus sp.]|jgi:hypothetical protein
MSTFVDEMTRAQELDADMEAYRARIAEAEDSLDDERLLNLTRHIVADCSLHDDSPDDVNRPRHYCGHPGGVECIEVVEHMNFCLGNAMKYIWRAPLHADLFH